MKMDRRAAFYIQAPTQEKCLLTPTGNYCTQIWDISWIRLGLFSLCLGRFKNSAVKAISGKYRLKNPWVMDAANSSYTDEGDTPKHEANQSSGLNNVKRYQI